MSRLGLLLVAYALAASAADDAIDKPLAAKGDAKRGRAIVASRQVGLCVLCHSGPFPEEPFMGNIAPSLAGLTLKTGLNRRVAYRNGFLVLDAKLEGALPAWHHRHP